MSDASRLSEPDDEWPAEAGEVVRPAGPTSSAGGAGPSGAAEPAGVADALGVIAAWPTIERACEQTREVCTRLRFHEGLRRRIPEAAAESRVRGAWANARLDGARVPAEVVRDLVTGVASWPPAGDPTWDRVRGAVQASAEAEQVGRYLSAAPAQALARLHLAAAQPFAPAATLGRPRPAGDDPGEADGEFALLPPPPADVGARLAGLGDIMRSDAPALLVAALVHAEIALVRPFVGGNALVARSAERTLLRSRGLDPTGVAVPEFGHLAVGVTAYIGALSAYATGTSAGLTAWVEHCAAAVSAGAQEGERIADTVRVGRLSDS